MPGTQHWRPRVVRTTGSLTEAIYGLVLATSVIAVSREYDSTDAGIIGFTVLVTGVVFWLAHVYARVLSRSIAHRRMLTRAEVREAVRHDWPLVEVTLPLVVILALGGIGVLPDRAAIIAATLAALLELAAAGAYAARTSGAGVRGTVLSTSSPWRSAAPSCCSRRSCTDGAGPARAQPPASAFDLMLSNSPCEIVPASSSDCAVAISLAGPPLPAASLTCWSNAACAASAPLRSARRCRCGRRSGRRARRTAG